ncbi:hypothetical protein [uncultured Gemmiger sp.]|uniref:hypothetical protein n=1 Tax=uncultured Gemmiger sp. TaxID=1623490 RepID=UPI0025CFDEEB|nr:hypothetical protein [uncultured Gemmiger sp.]
MKKVIALLCAAALAASLAACGGETSSPAATAAPEPTPTATPDVDADQPATPPEGETGENADDINSPEMPAVDPELNALVDSIYAEYEVPIMTATSAIDLSDPAWVKQYTGLDDGSQLEAAVASEAMISSQAYSLVLVRVAEGADAAEIADQMAAGINPAKWICVQADDVMVGAAGNVAMLVMVDSQLDIPAQSVADAFVAAAGEGASCWKPENVSTITVDDGGTVDGLTPVG